MKPGLFTFAALATTVAGSPIRHEGRQTNSTLADLLGDLLGTLSANLTFDYVVLGGGTGGLTIAKRLAEDPTATVAVIEAGSLYQVTDPILEQTPAGDVTFVGTSETLPTVDWGFFTSKDPASDNQARSYARGKCLGGSSARNFMIYQRPTIGSLQNWADAVDDQSYTFDNFLPYYKKSPNFTPPGLLRAVNATPSYNADAFSATGGPLQVSYSNYAQSFSSYMQGGLNEIGISTIQDFNSGSLLGCQYCSSTIRPEGETRDSSQTSFLNEAISEGLSNLKVFALTMAKKVNFDANKKAISVDVEDLDLIPYTINVNKEVILSAGAFQSPQLLIVSGIGPAAQVQALGVPLVQDLPGVGQNMQDHIFFGPAYRVALTTFTKLANDPVYLLAEFAQYGATETGPFANPVSDFLGWEKVPASLRPTLGAAALADLDQYPADWPEIEYISGAGYVGDWSTLLFGQPKDGSQYATILATLVAPRSRGNITVVSADTNTLPIINTAYLQSPTDQKVAIAAYKRVRQAFETEFMQRTVQGPEYYPGADVQTDDEILSTIKGSLQTVWHASSTCKMGVANDSMAVVDSHAKVFGVEGLRVVDASAFPFLPPGHPQSTVYALAEKIADDIKNGQ
ncbi:alcohol oxidase [Mollisia scopiformis]|uniref:Alcohol oxidase n=1 Tax=Mollisia scopiformis TaxID=149040 RepID=A0A194WSZ5_MOLSC|nr:alcohol oxidase [Mollisia scopiformis]KUJ10742.1 alcohol oxidase [Mollisia scopiformis]